MLGSLPSSFAPPRFSATQVLSALAAAGAAIWAYAGLYPRFDNGALRLVLAVTSVPFGALAMITALRSRSAEAAFGKMILVAGGLGITSTVVPALILCLNNPNALAAAAVFGVMCGAPTGILYGIPLGALAALGHRHVREGAATSVLRVARLGGAWLGLMAMTALACTWSFDASPHDPWFGADMVGSLREPVLPALGAALTLALGTGLAILAALRLRARRVFLRRVARGEEPLLRLTPLTDAHLALSLPWLGAGSTVLELVPEGAAAPLAYRGSSKHVPLAIVEDVRG